MTPVECGLRVILLGVATAAPCYGGTEKQCPPTYPPKHRQQSGTPTRGVRGEINLEGAGPEDIRVELEAGTLASVTVENSDGVGVLEGGEVVFASEDPWCAPTTGRVCEISVRRVQVRLATVSVETNVGDYDLENPVLSVEDPPDRVWTGTGAQLPAFPAGQAPATGF